MSRVWFRFALFALALLALACGSGSTEPTAPAPSPETPVEPPPAPEPPGPAPEVRVVAESSRVGVTARIENRSGETAEVGALALERQQGEQWVELPAVLDLRDSCDAEPVECFTLAPGAVLLPPAWTGTQGATSSQCACSDCDAAPDGTYRFVVRGCGNTEPATSAPFER